MIERARLWASRCFKGQILSLLLLLLIFAALVYGMADAIQGIERGLLWPLVWLGLILGWGLACSRMAGWLSAIVCTATGFTLTLLSVGQLGGMVATLLTELAAWAWESIQGGTPPDPLPIQSAWTSLADGVGTLVVRLYTWLLSLLQGQPSFDPIPIAFLWSLALWGAVIWASWAVRRRAQPLVGVAPVVALLASTLVAVGGRALYLLPMLPEPLVYPTLSVSLSVIPNQQ